MSAGIISGFQEIQEKFPSLTEVFSEGGDTIDYNDMSDSPSYYLQRAYEKLFKTGDNVYLDFINELCAIIYRHPEMLSPAIISIGESEFLRLSSLSKREVEDYLRDFPPLYLDIINTKALFLAINKGGFTKK